MFNNISWGIYCFALFITIIIYYLFVIIAFYRHEMSHYFEHFNKESKSYASSGFDLVENVEDSYESLNVETDLIPVQTLLDDLSEIIRHAAERQYRKAELLQAMRVKLNSYPEIFSDEQKTQVEATIMKDCNRYCSMHLEDEDRKVLWLD